MVREHLETASNKLDQAATAAEGSERERLDNLSSQLTTLADAEADPDHGRLARIQASLNEIKENVDAAGSESIEGALEDIITFRETLEGV